MEKQIDTSFRLGGRGVVEGLGSLLGGKAGRTDFHLRSTYARHSKEKQKMGNYSEKNECATGETGPEGSNLKRTPSLGIYFIQRAMGRKYRQRSRDKQSNSTSRA